MKPDEVVRHFAFEGQYAGYEPYKKGHINDTFIVSFKKDSGAVCRYILQRINHAVFKDPPALMANIGKVTAFLRKKVMESGGDPRRETLTIITTPEGSSFYKTPDGEYWRAYVFIENARSIYTVEKPVDFYNAGRAIGKFQNLLADFPVNSLHEIIPDFHNTPKRYKDFIMSVDNDTANRAEAVSAEIAFVEERSGEFSCLINLHEEGKLPLRVTHNDTKFNNVLLDDETGEGICLVDLDTVMPGLSLYDFGDAIRSGANTSGEDERNLLRVSMDINLFKEFCCGYLQSAGSFLMPREIENLPFSAWLITMECGMRFLTDYLNGDTYFKTRHPSHNLDRARTQFKLAFDMEKKFLQMQKTISELI